MSRISGNTGRKSNVAFASQDAGARDKKFEGYSNLKGANEQRQKKIQKNAAKEASSALEEEYILNLQKQIVLMEHEVKLLKDREVDQKNKASGYETLLRDGIPLNEHFLALKEKFNNEQDFLKKTLAIAEEEVRKEEAANKQKKHRIEIMQSEYQGMVQRFQAEKEAKLKQMKELETKLFTEEHTKSTLTVEKQELYEKVVDIKAINQNMGRQITKDKYHNNRDEIEKQRRKDIEMNQEEINVLSKKVEVEQQGLEEEEERNADPAIVKRQKEVTMNLKQDHNKIKTDITVAQNRIKDLHTRRDILNASLADILKDKRRIDKHNMELEDKIAGRNVTEEMTKRKHKNEERKMRIQYEKNVDNLKTNGVILMEKTADEEAKSKDVLDKKLKLEQELLDLKEDLATLSDTHQNQRDEIIKQRVKNSQLDSQNKMLDVEQLQLTENNSKLIEDNEELEKENAELKRKIAATIQRIDINNLLKEIDVEELQLQAKNNKQMNFTMENMITKWNAIVERNQQQNI